MSKRKRPLTAEEKRRKKRSALTSWALVLVMLLGLGIMAYPMVSDWWNSFHASRAIASYSNAVENVDKEKLDEMIRAAHEYNDKLLKKANPYVMSDEDLEEYTPCWTSPERASSDISPSSPSASIFPSTTAWRSRSSRSPSGTSTGAHSRWAARAPTRLSPDTAGCPVRSSSPTWTR